MHKTPLQKIIVLPGFLSGDAYSNTRRAVEALHRRGDIKIVELQLSTVRVLQYQKQFYAIELQHLIAVAAEYWPNRDVNLIASKVNSKPELMQQLLNTACIYGIAQRAVATIPSWHQSVADQYGLAPLFSMRQWSEIFNKHRSSVYQRKTRTLPHTPVTLIDIDSALQRIPVPQGGDE